MSTNIERLNESMSAEERRARASKAGRARWKKSEEGLRAGFWVALVLKPLSAPGRCYVGEVQSVDEHGVRITLMDWLIGRCCGYDVFVPWESLQSAMVADPACHDLCGFAEDAKRWQYCLEATLPGRSSPCREDE